MHLDAQGNLNLLSLSEQCEPARAFAFPGRYSFGSRTNLRFAPFRFVAPFPDDAVGPGAQWVTNEKVGSGGASIGQATFTLIELNATSALIGYYVPVPTVAAFTDAIRRGCRSCSKGKLPPVVGVARIQFGKLLPVAWLNYGVSTVPIESDPAHERTLLLESLQRTLVSGDDVIQIASVQGMQALHDKRAIELLLSASGVGTHALDVAIDGALRALAGDEQGANYWHDAAMLRYCTESSHARALHLLDKAVEKSNPKDAKLGLLYALRSLLRRDEDDLPGAKSDLTLALKFANLDERVILIAAWWYSTTTLDGERDGKRALSLLTKRVEARSPFRIFHRVRAAALAELQHYDEALESELATMQAGWGYTPASYRPALRELEEKANQARAEAYRTHHPWRGNLVSTEHDGCREYLLPEPW
jgi:hypothetical protein